MWGAKRPAGQPRNPWAPTPAPARHPRGCETLCCVLLSNVPELPEVETVRRGLEQQTLHQPIERVAVLRPRAIASPDDPQAFCEGLRGAELVAWQRRGKYLIGELRRGQTPAGHWVCTCA